MARRKKSSPAEDLIDLVAGANVGGEFWACTGYLACRGTRPIG